MKLKHIDEVYKSSDDAKLEQTVQLFEAQVADAVSRGKKAIFSRDFQMTPAFCKLLKESGYTYTKFENSISWRQDEGVKKK